MKFSNDTWNELRSLYEGRHQPESLQLLAELYWRTLLSVSLVCVVGILIFGTWEFISVLGELSSSQGGANSAPPAVLNRPQLESVLNTYDARQATYQATQANPVSIGDPSK
jgi:hypothetical protein